MKYDDLVEELGEFGPYQRKVYVITCLPAAVAAIQTLVSVFILAVPEHRFVQHINTLSCFGPCGDQMLAKSNRITIAAKLSNGLPRVESSDFAASVVVAFFNENLMHAYLHHLKSK